MELLSQEYINREMRKGITRALSSVVIDNMHSFYVDLSELSKDSESRCFVSVEELVKRFPPEKRIDELVEFYFKDCDEFFDIINNENGNYSEQLESAHSIMREIIRMVQFKLMDITVKYVGLKCKNDPNAIEIQFK